MLDWGSDQVPCSLVEVDIHALLATPLHLEHLSPAFAPELFMAFPQHMGLPTATGTWSNNISLSRWMDPSGALRPTQCILSPVWRPRRASFTGPPSLNATNDSLPLLPCTIRCVCPPGATTGPVTTVPLSAPTTWSSLHWFVLWIAKFGLCSLDPEDWSHRCASLISGTDRPRMP